MTTLTSWILSICVAAVVASIFKLVQPNGNMQKMMQSVIAIFILCIMILPLTSGLVFDLDHLNLDLTATQEVPTGLLDTANRQFENTVTTEVEENIRQSLQKFQITNAQIYLNINISDDFSISINKLEIEIDGSHRLKQEVIAQYIRQNYYENAEVVVK